ncbi:uracil-DNA glycosylase [Amnibacterium endophyticum]|uniref:Uracil-DNA glycosylase n=1 Tax=Amnibacterium endophyticum TaxID=2109337 RepID=A0ABW4LG09_9MICO
MSGALADLAERGLIAGDWASALAPAEDDLLKAEAAVRADRDAGATVLPADDLVLRAFRTPLERVRVLIVGQDPYPTPGHAIGLAFATARHVRPLPRSLVNVYRERADDLGLAPAAHGDLSAWADRGVLLLNRDLTVRAGQAASHRGLGWEGVTARAVAALAARGGPLVAVLWGRQAQALAPLLGDVPRIESAHPSPLSARHGFFGSRPFSRVDALLEQQGADAVDWSLPD